MENSISDNGLSKLLDFVQSFVETTQAGHSEARLRRDYVNNKQLSTDERAILARRKQPVIIDNRIKRKTDYFLGVERQTRTDPKCYPRTPESDKAAEAFTDAIRYVCDNSEWDIERSEGFDSLIVEGIEGFIVPVEKTPQGFEIKPHNIPWDRIIYDHHSSDRFFRDCYKKGIVTWMDLQDALDMFPGKEDILKGTVFDDQTTVFDDRPQTVWRDRSRERVKLIQLYYKEKGVWMHAVFTKAGYLIEPKESSYQDEYGRPDCPIELAGAYCDQDNDRFGPVQDMMSLQDMINKMESKITHFLNSERTWGNQKVKNIANLKKEIHKPDGHIELKGEGTLDQDFGIVSMDNKTAGTFNLLQEAISALDQIGGASEVQGTTASGRSKEIDTQTKLMEIGPVLDTHRQCSKRVYRQIFNRIRQYWKDEKWVRITDDENNLKFVKLNQKVTYEQAFEEKFGKDWQQKLPPQVVQQVTSNPNFKKVMEIRNNTSVIDVDIMIEDAPDVINIQQEQFALVTELAKIYGPQEVPFEEIVRLSTLRNKDAFLEKTKGDEQARQQQAQQQRDQENQMRVKAFMQNMEKQQAEIMATHAKTDNLLANTELLDNQSEAVEIANTIAIRDASLTRQQIEQANPEQGQNEGMEGIQPQQGMESEQPQEQAPEQQMGQPEGGIEQQMGLGQ